MAIRSGQDPSVLSHQFTMSAGMGDTVMNMNCELHWRLTMYLLDCGKTPIRWSQVRLIFQLLLSIIDERNLACPDSTDIYICDKELSQLVHMPHIHLCQLKGKILSLLTLSHSGRSVANPTDSYKHMVRRLYPQQLSTRVDQSQTTPPVEPVPPQRILWTMEAPLSSLLIGFVSVQPVEFRYILNLVMLYISDHRQTFCHPMNLEIAYIKDDELYQIFNTSFIHKSQLRGILRDHVTPVEVDQNVGE